MSYLDVQSVVFGDGAIEETLTEINSARDLGRSLARGECDQGADAAAEMIGTAVAEVRQALAFELRRAADLPISLATAIATCDDPDVAGPFLEESPMVTEAFILKHVGRVTPAARSCIARRNDVTGAVADALLECGDEKAALQLARNDKANIAPETMRKISAQFPESTRIAKSVKSAQQSSRIPSIDTDDGRKLPFNVLMSRARAFQKNGMLTSGYMVDRLNAGKIDELEAALCLMSNWHRRDVRKALYTSDETRLDLEQKCSLAPGAFSSNGDQIRHAYSQYRA